MILTYETHILVAVVTGKLIQQVMLSIAVPYFKV